MATSKSKFVEEDMNLKVYQILYKKRHMDWQSEKANIVLKNLAEAFEDSLDEGTESVNPEERAIIEKDSEEFYNKHVLDGREEMCDRMMKLFIKPENVSNMKPEEVAGTSQVENAGKEESDALNYPENYFQQGLYAQPVEWPKHLKNHPIIEKNANPTIFSAHSSQVLIEQRHRREMRLKSKRRIQPHIDYHANMARRYKADESKTEKAKEFRKKNTAAAMVSRGKNKVADQILSEEMELVFNKRKELLEQLGKLNFYDSVLRQHHNMSSVDWFANALSKKTVEWNLNYDPKTNMSGTVKKSS